MKISCSSQSFDRLFLDGRMDLSSFLKYAAEELKLKFVELEDKHFKNTDVEYVRSIKDEVDKYGLSVCNIAFDCSFGYPELEQNINEINRAKSWMKIGKKLGCKNFRVFAGWMGGLDRGIGKSGPPVEKKQAAWETMIQFVKEACDYAREMELDVVIENHNHGGFLSSSSDVLRLFEEVNRENLSLLLDTGNYVDGIPGIERTIHLVEKHIHLKANHTNEDGSDDLYDFETILSIIKDRNFKGSISIEYEGTQDELVYLPKIVTYLKNRLGE